MLILISGPNGSGKSSFAEQLIRRIPGTRYYIATMICQNEENRLRIQKHRNQRAGLGFLTIEEPYALEQTPVASDGVVLLEDLSNLLANLMFEKHRPPEEALRDVMALAGRCKALVVVTISGLCAEEYEGETAAYILALEKLNQRLFSMSDGAFELCGGVPVCRKGAFPDAT